MASAPATNASATEGERMSNVTTHAKMLRERIAVTLDSMPPGARTSDDLYVTVPLGALRTVLDALESVPEKDEWVPTAERLPEHTGTVLVRTASGDIRELRYMRPRWFLPDLSMYVYFDVEAWKAI